MPTTAGEYDVRPGSITFDGREYSFAWVDRDGTIHQARTSDLRMVQDDRTYLEIGNGSPILHLKPEEPVAVRGTDPDGNAFTNFWFPFWLGQTVGGLGGRGPVVINQPAPGTPEQSPRTPTYHFPPTDAYGPDDRLHGSVTNTRPEAPDYSKVKPAPYAVSGQNSGTGSGAAATSKRAIRLGGQSGGTGIGAAASSKRAASGGQSGGTGVGSAASGKSAPAVGGGSSKPKIGGGRSGGLRLGRRR